MTFFDFVKTQYAHLPVPITGSAAKGKTYIVTGANTGLGYECVKHLAQCQAKLIILAVRNTQAGENAKASIQQETRCNEAKDGKKGVEMQIWTLDLASYDSVKAFARRTESELDRVDGVVMNAGVAQGEWVLGEQGQHINYQVNVLSTLLLTLTMMPALESGAKKYSITPHVNIIGSAAGFHAEPVIGDVDRENVWETLADPEKFPGPMLGYPLSKLILFFAYRGLAPRIPVSKTGVVVTLTSPGFCKTALSRHAKGMARVQFQIMQLLLGRTSEQGSRTLLYGLTTGDEGHGKYLADCEIKEDAIPLWAKNEDGKVWAEQVWRQTADMLEKIEPGCLNVLEK